MFMFVFLISVLRCVNIAFLSDFLRFCVHFGLPLGTFWKPLPSLWEDNLRIFCGSGSGGAQGEPRGSFLEPFGREGGGRKDVFEDARGR